ncbi:MarR family winged helix-turn-helix transcriptional regulator [Burkholderia sp. IMCC1007]|uniref:MarR family winged helix-turn-helix transcriptional regulator n=1 Tax=Burkholderia sp. IMCC1007 TaxID=3004104 RepID=UPI0022B5144A|nr:MarR family transcriptional regulator [Burkholderia sp. IMCC1007]
MSSACSPNTTSDESDIELFLENQICFALYAAANKTIRTYTPQLKPMGITYPQYLVLLVLWQRGTVPMKTLEDALFLDSGTLSPLVRRMEKGGLVTRERGVEDERVTLIRLTPKGQGLKERARGMPGRLRCTIHYPVPKIVALRESLKDYVATIDEL